MSNGRYFRSWLEISKKSGKENEYKIYLWNQNILRRYLYKWAQVYEVQLKARLYSKLAATYQVKRKARMARKYFTLWRQEAKRIVDTKTELAWLHYRKTLLSKVIKVELRAVVTR